MEDYKKEIVIPKRKSPLTDQDRTRKDLEAQEEEEEYVADQAPGSQQGEANSSARAEGEEEGM